MTDFLMNYWYMGAWSYEVTETPMSRRLLGVGILFFRKRMEQLQHYATAARTVLRRSPRVKWWRIKSNVLITASRLIHPANVLPRRLKRRRRGL